MEPHDGAQRDTPRVVTGGFAHVDLDRVVGHGRILPAHRAVDWFIYTPREPNKGAIQRTLVAGQHAWFGGANWNKKTVVEDEKKIVKRKRW